jgi:hypothetical protein
VLLAFGLGASSASSCHAFKYLTVDSGIALPRCAHDACLICSLRRQCLGECQFRHRCDWYRSMGGSGCGLTVVG